MAATPYLLQLPNSDAMPSRTLRDGVTAMTINAGASADAVALAKAQYDDDVDVMWDQATATAVVAAINMSGWAFRVRVVSPLGVDVFDGTVEADGVDTGFVKATGTLTLTPGSIDAADNIKIDTTYYAWAVDPTTGTPDGSSGTPYLVALGANDTAALANMVKAINATGTGGVDYSVEITVHHATVEALTSNATVMTVRARTAGSAGNSISTTIPNASELLWGATTLTLGAGATDQVSSLALKMVAALNDSADISTAAWVESNQTLTVADTGDVLGDHRVLAYFIPVGADRDEVKGVPGFIVSTDNAGAASDDLSLVLQTNSYVIPKVTALVGSAQ
jgi:hypothetical protein